MIDHACHLTNFRNRLADVEIDGALVTDDDNFYYLTSYNNVLNMDFGRLTILVVPKKTNKLRFHRTNN